jgi:hypothetical protein
MTKEVKSKQAKRWLKTRVENMMHDMQLKHATMRKGVMTLSKLREIESDIMKIYKIDKTLLKTKVMVLKNELKNKHETMRKGIMTLSSLREIESDLNLLNELNEKSK